MSERKAYKQRWTRGRESKVIYQIWSLDHKNYFLYSNDGNLCVRDYLEGKPVTSAGVSSGMTSSVIGEEKPPAGVEGEAIPLKNWRIYKIINDKFDQKYHWF